MDGKPVFVWAFFFFNDTATTEIYTLSLHDALPIATTARWWSWSLRPGASSRARRDRKSTRLNSSHSSISYAVFCLKKKINKRINALPITKKITKSAQSHLHDVL